jgi:hypothetical protein
MVSKNYCQRQTVKKLHHLFIKINIKNKMNKYFCIDNQHMQIVSSHQRHQVHQHIGQRRFGCGFQHGINAIKPGKEIGFVMCSVVGS